MIMAQGVLHLSLLCTYRQLHVDHLQMNLIMMAFKLACTTLKATGVVPKHSLAVRDSHLIAKIVQKHES